MSIATLIYFSSVSENLSCVFLILGVLGVLLSFGIAVAESPLIALFSGSISLILLTIAAFLPSQETIFLMIASDKITQTQIPDKVNLIINQKLDQLVKSTKPSSKDN